VETSTHCVVTYPIYLSSEDHYLSISCPFLQQFLLQLSINRWHSNAFLRRDSVSVLSTKAHAVHNRKLLLARDNRMAMRFASDVDAPHLNILIIKPTSRIFYLEWWPFTWAFSSRTYYCLRILKTCEQQELCIVFSDSARTTSYNLKIRQFAGRCIPVSSSHIT